MDKEFPMIPARGQSSDEVIFADTVFGFWEDVQAPLENSSNYGNDDHDFNDYDDDETVGKKNNKAFWEEQDQLLQVTLCRTSSSEKRVRQATKEALRELNVSEITCFCRRPVVGQSCRNCLQRELCDRLLNLGYNCAICKSKWRSSSGILSGEHTYLEVMDKSSDAKKEVKVVIELNFRAEFEMARPNEEYNQLIKRLPEVFIGKAERLRVLVKIMCSAAKRCMKEKKMHMGPWRKHKYMQAKWFGTCDRSTMEPLIRVYPTRPPKPKGSILTWDLLENTPGLHCNAVEVV